MSFLSPALLLGLLAAAIPPVLHLMLRRKAVQVRFPALEFILRSNRKTARRFRFKQLMLMLVRSLLLALLAFALARPFLHHDTDPAAVAADAGGTTVVVLDAGYPMGFALDDETLLDRARFLAESLLDDGNGMGALVVAGDRVTTPFAEPTGDLAAVRRALEEVAVGHRADRLGDAVARAYEMLDDAPPGGRRVVVLTTAAGAASDLPRPPPTTGDAAIDLVPIDVSEGRPTPNRAVLGVTLQPAPEMGTGHWRVEARIGNFGPDAIARLPVHVEVDGVPTVRGFLDLGPGEEGVKTFYVNVDQAAATPAAVVIEPDALPADDRRPFWLQPAPQMRVLAVNGDPRPTPYRDELFYLERALSPLTAAGARVRLDITDVPTLQRRDLDDFDVVVLANVGELAADRARALEAFVRGGGGLLVSMGDQVKPTIANDLLGALLPRTLRDVRQAGDAAASAEAGDRRAARPNAFERGHAILRTIPNPAATSLGSAQIRRYMLLDPAADASGEVVVGLDDGAPLLLTRTVGQGRVALLTTTLDRDWGDLPIRADFLPLLQQTLRFLTRVAELDSAPVVVGRPAPVPVEDPRVQRVRVRAPDGDLRVVERPKAEADPWVFEGTASPGHYRVEPDPPLPGLVALPGFAVALDPAGADLRGPAAKSPAGEDVAAAGAGVATSVTKRTELWHAALFGLFLLLLGEAALLFRRRDADEIKPLPGRPA